MSIQERNRVAALLLAPAIFGLGACGSGDASEQAQASEEPAAATEAAEAVPTIPSGTVIPLRLEETISTSSHSAGDQVSATVTEAVRGPDGSVLVPSGSRMLGVVEESARSSGPEDPAVLAFHFETLRVGGADYPVTAVVESAEPRRTEGDSGAETAAKVAIGTAAGALVGQILGGDTESTLKGAAAGTVAGAVIAITSRSGDASLERGSLISVRTQAPVRLS